MKSRVKWLLQNTSVFGVIIGLTAGFTSGAIGVPLPERSPEVSTSLDRIQLDGTQVSTTYTLGAGDKVRIEIFRMPQYSGENTVSADGQLNLAQVGSIDVTGLTLEQAAAEISRRYASILRHPLVNITLLSPRPFKVGVAGEVRRPGAYTVTRETIQFPTVTELLKMAGGVQQSADLRNIQVRRPQPQGGDQVISVNLMQFLQTGESKYNFPLRDGDSVYVPTASSVNLTESRQIATASFAPEQGLPINIAVIGEVYRPGPHTVTGTAKTADAGVPGDSSSGFGLSPTITRALQVAGGITPTANIRQVEVHRITQLGSEQVFRVDLWKLLREGDLSQDTILQDQDTVVVPTATTVDLAESNQIAAASFSPDKIRVNIVGELVRPGVVEVPPNTPLNQAILAAGGLNNRASSQSVQLLRLNPNGTVSRQAIDINLAQGVNESTNPPLRNNDVVIVRRSTIASISDTLDSLANPFTRFLGVFATPFSLINLFR